MSLHCDTTADEELVHIPDEILESPRAGVKRKGGGPRLTDAQRMEILQAIETAVEAQADNKNLLKPKIPTKRLADEYGVTPAAIRKLVKQKDKFLSRFETGREDVRQSRRRGGDGAKIEFERELYRWVCGLRARNVTIVPSYIQQRALLVAKKYPNMDKFQASWGWYYRFCTRYNVTGGAISTAPASSDNHLMHLDDTSDGTLLSHMDMPMLVESAVAHASSPSVAVPPLSKLTPLASAKPRKKPDFYDEKMYLDAAKMGDTHTLQSCLLKGTYIDSVDEAGCTALVLATQGGHFHVMKFLIEHGAKPDATDESGSTVLVLATKQGFLNAVKVCLEASARVDATDPNLKTPLILAAERGDLKAIKMLLKFGANIEATDEDDGTALIAAVKYGQRDVVEYLVKKGANKQARHIDGLTPTELAQSLGHADLLSFDV
ncbi:hypothetical protein H257_08172 [Aphanomyces astaci]|uniref:HTH CENPB-type domain-containing protein n=2 Tax=Aphanomyces astaci TaxID=112090 RepID=W4GFS7_APHAT|nr:hypothetical protein H257_08172 [Aphanomyces astaci]ETV77924.1 hypothetical protein H257_08172 [Aphanomyces astaci]|eukprot:XP_009832261.1 hypothetical protein H257_08172 [Aphanomyces astaci]